MSSPAERLKLAMQRNAVRSGAELARRSGQNDVTVRSHLNGTRAISRKAAEAYSRALDLEPSWLLFGVGPEPVPAPSQPVADIRAGRSIGAARRELTPVSGFRPDDGGIEFTTASVPDFRTLRRDVPVLGTAECGDNGAFTLDSGDPIDFVRRPPGIASRKGVYCIYTEGSSMEPVYESGDLVFADPHRPPRPGRDVIVQLRGKAEGDETRYLLKRLVRRTSTKWILRQFNPLLELTFADRDVIAVHLVLKNHELLGI